jgi:peptide chain release factor 1
MYERYSSLQSWKFEVLSSSLSTEGGLKEGSAAITGSAVFGALKWEVGVHRVQRVPLTEGAGRVHTSTASVAVLPQATEVRAANDEKIKFERRT